MTRTRTVGLSVVFLAIALFVSASLIMSLRSTYAVNGQAPDITSALHLLQRA